MMLRRLPGFLRMLTAMFAASVGLSAGTFVDAAETEVTQIGWQGKLQLGRWTAVRVKLDPAPSSEAILFEVEAPDAEGNRTIRTAAGVATENPGEYEFLVRPGRLGAKIQVRVRSDEKIHAQTTFTLPASAGGDSDLLLYQESLFAVVSSEPDFNARATDAFSDYKTLSGRSVRVARFDSPDAVPYQARGWESLDVLLLCGQFDLATEKIAALEDWVRSGGHLILASGTQWDQFEQSPISENLSIVANPDEVAIRDLNELESFAGQSSRLSLNRRIQGRTFALSNFDERLFGSIDGDLAGTKLFGFGRVTFVGLDLQSPPISEWNALPRLLQELAYPKINRGLRETEVASQQLTQSGISELATQFNLAQQAFPEAGRSSTWTVLGAILLYLMIVGPLDYLLVHRVFERPQLTWITYPVWLIGVAGVSVWAGSSTNAIGTQLNQVDLLDISTEKNFLNARSWSTVYSSETQRAAVAGEFQSDWLQSSQPEMTHLMWDSIPEEGFRGLYRKTGLEFASATYSFSAETPAIENLPIAQWSTRSQWLAQNFDEAANQLAQSDLQASSLGSVSGTFSHQLPGTLVNWMLAYRNRVYFPRPLRTDKTGIGIEPNRPLEITRRDLTASRDLKGFLTGTRQIREQAPDRNNSTETETRIVVKQDAYDPFSDDVPEIVRMFCFHQAAGGEGYTGLNNFALDRLDWSRLLDPHHAVLFGQLELEPASKAANWTWNGSDVPEGRRVTFVRILLPVTLRNEVRRELPDLDKNRPQ